MQFAFGQSERERIAVDVLSYERPACGEYYDDNWIIVNISVRVSGFQGKARATFLTDELVRFADQLRTLYDKLTGSAEFTTMEGQLSLKLAGDGMGHVHLDGAVLDQAGIGNELLFTLDFDQTLLAQSIRDLSAVIKAFPVRAARG